MLDKQTMIDFLMEKIKSEVLFAINPNELLGYINRGFFDATENLSRNNICHKSNMIDKEKLLETLYEIKEASIFTSTLEELIKDIQKGDFDYKESNVNTENNIQSNQGYIYAEHEERIKKLEQIENQDLYAKLEDRVFHLEKDIKKIDDIIKFLSDRILDNEMNSCELEKTISYLKKEIEYPRKKELTDTERLDFIEKHRCYIYESYKKWSISGDYNEYKSIREAIDAAMRKKDGE
jgi:hypothetical protein